MKKACWILVIWMMTLNAAGQENEILQLLEDQATSGDASELEEDLHQWQYLLRHPLNLNRAICGRVFHFYFYYALAGATAYCLPECPRSFTKYPGTAGGTRLECRSNQKNGSVCYCIGYGELEENIFGKPDGRKAPGTNPDGYTKNGQWFLSWQHAFFFITIPVPVQVSCFFHQFGKRHG